MRLNNITMKTKTLKRSNSLSNTILFPEIIDSQGDNNPSLYIDNSPELDRYYEVLMDQSPKGGLVDW